MTGDALVTRLALVVADGALDGLGWEVDAGALVVIATGLGLALGFRLGP